MWIYYFSLAVFSIYWTGGEVWPQPQQENKGYQVYLLSPAFKFQVVDENCTLLSRATKRYEERLGVRKLTRRDRYFWRKNKMLYETLRTLRLDTRQLCERYPHAEMDESYNLTISNISELRSNSVWGALRGLETFAQMVDYLNSSYKVQRVIATEIVDFPRYQHRGFLIDTARHYLSAALIMTHLEAMSMNKYNVLHWHITDSESFPYHSEKLMEMSLYGAFYTYRVYDKATIRKIVDFAAERGIRVIPEIDMPAHTRSWGKSHPEIMMDCSRVQFYDIAPGLHNPAANATYQLIGQLITELRGLFPDKYMHLGGDEVPYTCWNKELKSYMKQNNLTTTTLFDKYLKRVRQFLSDRIPIYWEEVFTAGVALPQNSVVQIWLSNSVEFLTKIIKSDLPVLYSRDWYLDNGTTLESTYRSDPRSIFYNVMENSSYLTKIIGGEACLWSEHVDGGNFHKKAWPRAAAIAEVLWSARDLNSDPEVPIHRVKEQMTRMHRQGIVEKATITDNMFYAPAPPDKLLRRVTKFFSDLLFSSINLFRSWYESEGLHK